MRHLNTKQKKLIILSSLGGVLEFYDFIIYALLASYIAQVFFPTKDQIMSLMITFSTFSVGYLARPFGGIILGHYGDKIGRKKVFTLSIFVMAISTFLIGLTPSYQTIGIAAPIIVTILRIFQGFSVGGEIPGAITYLSESVPKYKGLACGFLYFALINGIVLGTAVSAILTSNLNNAEILQWGWRIPFLLGGVLGIIGYFLRKKFQESPLFKFVENDVVKFPFLELLKKHFSSLFIGIFITALGASLISLLFLYTPVYLTKLLHYPVDLTMWINTTTIFIVAILALIFGFLSDFLNKKFLLIGISILTMLCTYFIFHLFTSYQFSLFVPMLISALLVGTIWGVIPPMLAELFPTNVRYSGIACVYNIAHAIFAGLTPLIAMTFIKVTANLESPAFYPIITGITGLIAATLIPTKKLFLYKS